MKLLRLLSSLAIALSVGNPLPAGAGPVGADASASAIAKPATMGRLADLLRPQMAAGCDKARQRLAAATPEQQSQAQMDVELNCTCSSKVLDATFPADRRATVIAPLEVQARLKGAGQICAADAIEHMIQRACAQGQDPLAGPGEQLSAPQIQARCECVKSQLETFTSRDLTKAADDAQAAYEQGRPPIDKQLGFGDIERACRAAAH